MPSVLIKNARIVTMNAERAVLDGNLLVRDGRIAAIGTIDTEADTTIDADGSLLIPGLVQTHVHLCQSLFRGQADDLELLDWLRKRIWPLEGAHDEESVYYSALLGIGEMLSGGTTSIVDMETVHHTKSAFQAIGISGIRALSGKCMMDFGDGVPESLMEKTAESLEESALLCEKWNGAFDGRLSYAFAPRFAVSCSETLLREVGALSRLYGTKIHTHASENRGEIELVQSLRGMRNVQYFEQLGLAGKNLILAHCIWLDEKELDIIAENGVNVVHCPTCNLKLASGIADVPKMLKRNVNVSIGTDGAPCNNNLDGFGEMRLTALVHKPANGPTAMPARTVVEMATLNGAKAMGLENEIGSLEAGKKADLVLVNVKNMHCTPSSGADVYSQLVYQARYSDVTMTMVDGKIVYRDGRLLTIDEADCIEKCGEAIVRVKKRAGIS